jgi:hypothetical protein
VTTGPTGPASGLTDRVGGLRLGQGRWHRIHALEARHSLKAIGRACTTQFLSAGCPPESGPKPVYTCNRLKPTGLGMNLW